MLMSELYFTTELQKWSFLKSRALKKKSTCLGIMGCQAKSYKKGQPLPGEAWLGRGEGWREGQGKKGITKKEG